MKQPKTFLELQKFVLQINKSNVLLRLPKDQQEYNTKGKLDSNLKFISKIKETLQKQKAVLLPSNFPYTWLLQKLPRVKHYILWFDGNNGRLANQIMDLEKQNLKFCYFENNPNRRSIADISHYHFFVEVS
jgi:hypothetical protein